MRNITTLENNQYYIEYYYNANNIRTGKYIYNGVKDNDVAYILDGNKIIRETRTGDENYVINYYYDSSDNVIGFEYNNNKYLYLKNLQNDIIGIVDEAGNLVVEYTYDAYGNIIKLIDTSNCDLSTVNPFRYRSYYYDKETGWYYLNSRYYNPIIGRFITMDGVEYLGASGTALSMNLFSYCENNPVNNVDFEGNFGSPIQWVMAAIGAIAGWFFGDYIAKQLGYKSGWKYWAIKTGVVIGGAVIGWFAGSAIKSLATKYLFSNPQVLAKMPAFVKWFLGLGGGGGALAKALNDVLFNTINHIMQLKHAWNLVGANDWNSVKPIIDYTITNGSYYINDVGNYIYSAPYNGQIVVVSVRIIDGIIRIVDAYVKTR